jgi:hypothetical protein
LISKHLQERRYFILTAVKLQGWIKKVYVIFVTIQGESLEGQGHRKNLLFLRKF